MYSQGRQFNSPLAHSGALLLNRAEVLMKSKKEAGRRSNLRPASSFPYLRVVISVPIRLPGVLAARRAQHE